MNCDSLLKISKDLIDTKSQKQILPESLDKKSY